MLQVKWGNEKLLGWTHSHVRRLQKSCLKLLPLLVIVAFGAVTNSLLFLNASATYVEGEITQDTLWTLTDSPFVVSKDITVYSGATLTMEPGIEVRFGGNFSLIIEGRLSAKATQDNMIMFTSNKDQPGSRDWNTIQFSGAQQSELIYCSVKYATNGIAVENGEIRIENCEIGTSGNGLTLVNSRAEITNNDITNNLESGIYITGDNQVTIQNNTIRSNKNGIVLTGGLTTGVSITENTVLSNTESGIQLNAEGYNNLVILKNVLSANNRGFHVSGKASTYIRNNSISYNDIGIFYQGVQNYAGIQAHEAYWNDIYGNELGMGISSGPDIIVTVDAEYNYWGDESGPYHRSLNPNGKGNPVGGDGVNLDFIFFLTAPIGYINQRPTARLLTDKSVVPPNHEVTFIGTTSSDDRQVDRYFYDFGDGETSGWTSLSIFAHEYSSTGTYTATLMVMDDFAVTSNNLATVIITSQEFAPLDVSLALNSSEVGSTRQVSLTIQATSGTSPVENASISLLSIVGGILTPSSGITNSTGHFTAAFSAPNVTQITNVRLIATASKSNFADGSDHKYLRILPPLLVQVTADPETIKSEATANVAVHVSYSGSPVPDATVVISSGEGGTFDQEIGTTDESGDCTFVFTALQTGTHLNVTITATATKSGYIDGQSQTKIAVEQALLVQIVANPVSIHSEMTSNMTIRVTYESSPIPDAIVMLLSDKGGQFSPMYTTTDVNGECVFVFTSPRTTEPTNFTITATAAKIGYADGRNQTTVVVNPGQLAVQVIANPSTVESEAISTITVHVTSNTKPTANVVVTVSSEGVGQFSFTISNTDINGDCTFVFTAPSTGGYLDVTITAIATKSGYITGQGQTRITVNPAPPNFMLTTIIIVVAVITVITIILVLIKLRIIVISWKEA